MRAKPLCPEAHPPGPLSHSPLSLCLIELNSSILAVGLYKLGVNGVTVLEGVSPHHIVTFFARHGSEAWRMLGGVMLCFTGVEAMFADLGHFSLPAIRVSEVPGQEPV